MKIAIVMHLAEQRGGAEMTLLDLIRHGRDRDVEWLVVFLQDGPLVRQVQALGVPTQVIPSGRLRQVYRYATAIRGIASVVREEEVDLVLSWMWMTHMYGGAAARLASRPAVWFEQEHSDATGGIRRLAMLVPARGVVTTTQAARIAQEQRRPRRRVRQVYPGVDLDRFHPSAVPPPAKVRRVLGLPDGGPLIGIFGRLQRWKGMHVVIAAMPTVLRHHPDARCVIVGGRHDLEAEYEHALRDQVAALRLCDQVVFAGLQSNVPEWMQAMDVVVHASDREPFGIVVLEAMALGKPVVAGADGGPTEIITDGVHGLLSPYGDVNALAERLLQLLGCPDFAATVGAAARQRALQFSTRHFAAGFVQAIRELVPSQHLPASGGR